MPRRRRQPPVQNRRLNLRRRGAVDAEHNEEPPARRQRIQAHPQVNPPAQPAVNEPANQPPDQILPQVEQQHQPLQPHQNLPQVQPLGEVNINFEQPLLIPNINEVDIFINQSIKEKIWLFQYVDMALLHKSNLNRLEQQQVISVNENGKLVAETKLAKTKAINNIEAWTDAFISYSQVLIERHPHKASELFSYIAIIRSAASQCSIEKWYTYDQQFRLRVARDHTKSWGCIDSQLWLQFVALGIQKPQIQTNNKCYDFNFKGECHRYNCVYKHICIKCSMNHPALLCRKYLGYEAKRIPVNRPPRPLLPRSAITAYNFGNRVR